MRARTVPLASLAIVIALTSVNIGAALGKSLFALVGPEGVAALRTSIAAIILLVVARAWSARFTRRQALWMALYGIALGGMNLLIYWAIARIPIGIAVTIEICGPLAVVLLTSRSTRDFLWFALAVAGLLLLMPWPGAAGTSVDPAGVLYALGAATCWALYILFGKRAAEAESGVAVAAGMAIACLVTLPAGISVAGGNLLLPEVLLLGAVVAVLSSALPYYLEMRALEKLSSRLFGLVTSSAPAIAALVGFFMLGERLTPMQWMAVCMMIVASAGCSLASRPPVEHPGEDVMS